MVEVILYKLGTILVGAVITALIDKGIGFEWERNPLWKHYTHITAYMLFGAIIVMV